MEEEKKKSKKSIIITIILILLLIIVLALNISIMIFDIDYSKILPFLKNDVTNSAQIDSSTNSQNIQKNKNTINENIISNSTNTAIDITDENTVVVDFTDGLNTEELRELMERYSVGIQRISFDEENLESNTILLFIAKQFFDSNASKSSLEVNTNYAPTLKNIHTYLSELTGRNYSQVEYIPSYANYIGYVKASKTYIFGNDYNNIKKEVYNCSNLSILEENDGLYTAKADVTRTIDKEVTNYEITFTFTINKNFTYEKYCIKSLKVKNTSFYPDNTIHLVDTPVEE